jgi:ADP-ribose pyrophosphatase
MTLKSTTRLYSGRVFDVDLDTVEFPDESTGQLEMIRHPGAAAVLPFLDPPSSADPRVALIYQFRHAADGYVWEIPAGRLDPGESPEDCARREMLEETGYTAGRVDHVASIYTTPGFTDEIIHLFAGEVTGAGDHDREIDEFLEVHPLRWSEVGRMVARGDIVDGKTLCCLFYLQHSGHGRTATAAG